MKDEQQKRTRGRPRNVPVDPAALRARGRTDLDARARREILQRQMLDTIERAGQFFANGGTPDMIAALASGTRRTRGLADLYAADQALQQFAQRMIEIWKIWREADTAVREIETAFGYESHTINQQGAKP
ncbi:MAG: hypothetical protein ACYDBH_03040 [Acidobacteriaceae bacterium]